MLYEKSNVKEDQVGDFYVPIQNRTTLLKQKKCGFIKEEQTIIRPVFWMKCNTSVDNQVSVPEFEHEFLLYKEKHSQFCLFLFYFSTPPPLKKNLFFFFLILLFFVCACMGLPLLIRKPPGTLFSWEKNEWYRKHGYNLPFDTFLISQWTCLFILDASFFYFLTHFLTVYENVESPSLDFESLKLTLSQIEQGYINPYTTWSSIVMAFFTTLVKVLSVTTSMIDTEDPVVAKERGKTPRSPTYIRRYGAPVIDVYSGVCNICKVKV